MSSGLKMWMVNDWQKAIGDHLKEALNISIEVCGRTGVEACKHAIILMAQSARAMAFQSKKNRPIEHNAALGTYVRVHRQNGEPYPIFKWQFDPRTNEKYRMPKGTWEKVKRIANQGLAKQSWMWGLKAINAPVGSDGKPIPGVASTRVLLSEKVCGFILTNKLSYIHKAMPAGWLSMVHELAANKIMKQAAMKMQNNFARAVKGMARSDQVTLAQAFIKAAA